MYDSLEKFAPKGRANCLCGSGERYKNCCKEHWPRYGLKDNQSITSVQRLKKRRAHLTWYRLCHVAHTAPLMAVESGTVRLLELDLKALQGIVREIFHSYKECGLVERYPAMLRELSRAIDDERWGWVLAGEEALFYMVVAEDYKVAQKILAIYNWRDIDVSEFLEVYLDAFSEKLLHVECIEIATRIVELTACASSRFHYQFVIACQYFLLKETLKKTF